MHYLVHIWMISTVYLSWLDTISHPMVNFYMLVLVFLLVIELVLALTDLNSSYHEYAR